MGAAAQLRLGGIGGSAAKITAAATFGVYQMVVGGGGGDQSTAQGAATRLMVVPTIGCPAPRDISPSGLGTVRWTGSLRVEARGVYRFFLYGRGSLSLGGAVVLVGANDSWSEVAFEFGSTAPLELDCSLAVDLRNCERTLEWSGAGFGRRPVSPTWAGGVLQRVRSDATTSWSVSPTLSQSVRRGGDGGLVMMTATGWWFDDAKTAMQWMATLTADGSDRYTFELTSCSAATLWIDHSAVIRRVRHGPFRRGAPGGRLGS